MGGHEVQPADNAHINHAESVVAIDGTALAAGRDHYGRSSFASLNSLSIVIRRRTSRSAGTACMQLGQ